MNCSLCFHNGFPCALKKKGILDGAELFLSCLCNDTYEDMELQVAFLGKWDWRNFWKWKNKYQKNKT